MQTDMQDSDGKKDFKVYQANRTLQARVGTGPLDDKAVERSQQVMDANKVDFAPIAEEFLNDLAVAIKTARANPGHPGTVQLMTTPVMQLKANASTFRYTLVSNLANIMLNYLEAVQKVDNDVIAIVEAHQQSLRLIIAKKITGDGGPIGKQMQEELQSACQRYFAKKKS